MPSRLQFIVRVLPNPFHSLDHEGRPAGHCPKERPANMAPGSHQGYVGATLMASHPEALEPGHQGTASQDTVWHFSREPQSFADPRGYYRIAMRNGELFPADAKTAQLASVEFKPYADYLKQALAEATAKWRAAFGEDPPSIDPFTKPVPGWMPGDAAPAPAEGANTPGMQPAFEAPRKGKEAK